VLVAQEAHLGQDRHVVLHRCLIVRRELPEIAPFHRTDRQLDLPRLLVLAPVRSVKLADFGSTGLDHVFIFPLLPLRDFADQVVFGVVEIPASKVVLRVDQTLEEAGFGVGVVRFRVRVGFDVIIDEFFEVKHGKIDLEFLVFFEEDV
jgi:hypothetical protein